MAWIPRRRHPSPATPVPPPQAGPARDQDLRRPDHPPSGVKKPAYGHSAYWLNNEITWYQISSIRCFIFGAIMDASAQFQSRPKAPGAKASFHCGLWALITAVFCFPVSIVLSIIAIVKNSKAKRLARENVSSFEKPGSSGMIMGITALIITFLLWIVGIMAAVSIPAILGQRERARSRAVQSMVMDVSGEIARINDTQREIDHSTAADPFKVVHTVLEMPQFRSPAAKNPYGGASSPYAEGMNPGADGQITLEPVTGHSLPGGSVPVPAVIIRAQYRMGGETKKMEKVVVLD